MAVEKKTKGEVMSEKLLSEKKNGGLLLDDKQIKTADDFCEGYKDYMNTAKIEREAVIESVRLAKQAGFKEYVRGKKYKAGEKEILETKEKTKKESLKEVDIVHNHFILDYESRGFASEKAARDFVNTE